ncbi:Histone-lysine N-methyltransferase set9 [Gaertneriomyces sp. JEL0708]|nr:Histone-lysine N-methyltransferase set9 [Gaertneriomyces sp. JEL0708]
MSVVTYRASSPKLKRVVTAASNGTSDENINPPLDSTSREISPAFGGGRRKMDPVKFADLADYDDVLCDVVLDSVYLGFRTHKMNADYYGCSRTPASSNSVRRHDCIQIRRDKVDQAALTAAVVDIIRKHVLQKDIEKGTEVLMSLFLTPQTAKRQFKGIKALQRSFEAFSSLFNDRTSKQLDDFKVHAKRYLAMYHPSAGFEVAQTQRYKTSGKVEACLIATRDFKSGDEIRHCTGVMANLSEQEEEYLLNCDFSVIYSSKRGWTSLQVMKLPPTTVKIILEKTIANVSARLVNGVLTRVIVCASLSLADLDLRLERGGFTRKDELSDLLNGDEYEKPIVAKLRRNQARSQTWSYYRDILAGVDISDKRRESGSDLGNQKKRCDSCSIDLELDVKLDSVKKAVRNNDHSTSRMECKRCTRHFKIYGVPWPKRKYKNGRLPEWANDNTKPSLVASTNANTRNTAGFSPQLSDASNVTKLCVQRAGSRKSMSALVGGIASDVQVQRRSHLCSSSHQKLTNKNYATQDHEAAKENGDSTVVQRATCCSNVDTCALAMRTPQSYLLSLQKKLTSSDSSSRNFFGTVVPDDDCPYAAFVFPGEGRKFQYWWPAVVIPIAEIDETMPLRTRPEQRIVCYFAGNSYGVVDVDDLRLFIPGEEPYTTFQKIPRFSKDIAVKRAEKFFETGEVPMKHRWPKWGTAGTAQDALRNPSMTCEQPSGGLDEKSGRASQRRKSAKPNVSNAAADYEISTVIPPTQRSSPLRSPDVGSTQKVLDRSFAEAEESVENFVTLDGSETHLTEPVDANLPELAQDLHVGDKAMSSACANITDDVNGFETNGIPHGEGTSGACASLPTNTPSTLSCGTSNASRGLLDVVVYVSKHSESTGANGQHNVNDAGEMVHSQHRSSEMSSVAEAKPIAVERSFFAQDDSETAVSSGITDTHSILSCSLTAESPRVGVELKRVGVELKTGSAREVTSVLALVPTGYTEHNGKTILSNAPSKCEVEANNENEHETVLLAACVPALGAEMSSSGASSLSSGNLLSVDHKNDHGTISIESIPVKLCRGLGEPNAAPRIAQEGVLSSSQTDIAFIRSEPHLAVDNGLCGDIEPVRHVDRAGPLLTDTDCPSNDLPVGVNVEPAHQVRPCKAHEEEEAADNDSDSGSEGSQYSTAVEGSPMSITHQEIDASDEVHHSDKESMYWTRASPLGPRIAWRPNLAFASEPSPLRTQRATSGRYGLRHIKEPSGGQPVGRAPRECIPLAASNGASWGGCQLPRCQKHADGDNNDCTGEAFRMFLKLLATNPTGCPIDSVGLFDEYLRANARTSPNGDYCMERPSSLPAANEVLNTQSMPDRTSTSLDPGIVERSKRKRVADGNDPCDSMNSPSRPRKEPRALISARGTPLKNSTSRYGLPPNHAREGYHPSSHAKRCTGRERTEVPLVAHECPR